jgi:hypothetical protein
MLYLATDASLDEPICSCGYAISRAPEDDPVETGIRVLNTEATTRGVRWCATRAEYRALITGVRAVTAYATHPSHETVLCIVDSEPLVRAVTHPEKRTFEPYFRHAVYSFLGRFNDWSIRCVDRSRNHTAHERAREGFETTKQLLATSP